MNTHENTTAMNNTENNNTPNFYPNGLVVMGKVYKERRKARKRNDFHALEWDLDLGMWAKKVFFNDKFPNRKARLIEYATIKFPNEYEGTLGMLVSVMEAFYELHQKWTGDDKHKNTYDFMRYAPILRTNKDGVVNLTTIQMNATATGKYDNQLGRYPEYKLWEGTAVFDSLFSSPCPYIVKMLCAVMKDELSEVLPQLGLKDVQTPKIKE